MMRDAVDADADAFCQGLADAAGLPGIYRVWLSDSTGSPSTRFTRSTIPWIMPSGSNGGIILADNWTDLTDSSIDARFGQSHELVKYRVLQGDRKRQDAIEPPLDRR